MRRRRRRAVFELDGESMSDMEHGNGFASDERTRRKMRRRMLTLLSVRCGAQHQRLEHRRCGL